MILEILDEARNDIVSAHDWYESKRDGLGADFELCLEEAFGRICAAPETYPVWYRNTRRLVLARFPYGIFFRADRGIVLIVGVFHLKRNPGWVRSGIRKRRT